METEQMKGMNRKDFVESILKEVEESNPVIAKLRDITEHTRKETVVYTITYSKS